MKTIKTNLIISAVKDKPISEATSVFSGWIDSDFKNWNCDATTKTTSETLVTVSEMDQDLTFAQIFPIPEKQTLTQGQIIDFCEEHQDWLRKDGYSTFFLFKVGGEFFVADVRWSGRRLEADVFRLSCDGVWRRGGRRRVVVPQLAPILSGTSEPLDTLTLEALHNKVDLLMRHLGVSIKK